MQRQPTPSWPSLYEPGVEILHLEHRDPVQPTGFYLYNAHDVFRFTLYWTLILYTPIFIFCGAYAFINLSFLPSRSIYDNALPLSPLSPAGRTSTPLLRTAPLKLPKRNEGRSRLTFTILVLLTFLAMSVAGAVIGAAIIGFVLAGLYNGANYNMSTWVPFVWSSIYVLVGFLSIWPSIIDII